MILYYSKAKLEKTLDIVRKTMQKVLLTKNSKKLKKTQKNSKKCLTFQVCFGILTKLFDGDEVNESGA